METIETYRLNLDPADGESWDGVVVANLYRYDLKIIRDSICSAEYEGIISIEDANYLLEKLNLEKLY